MPIKKSEHEAWIRRYHRAPDAPTRVVFFPHAGGSATFYFPVSAALSPKLEVFAVQYPGRQERHRDPLIDNVPELADRVAEVLSVDMDKPTAFFGHSMGAIVAFEVALRLEAAGLRLVRSYASGRRGPTTVRDERVHEQDDDGVIAQLKWMSGTDSRLFGDGELLRLIMPAVRNDYRAIETYQGARDATVSCPITVLVGDADPTTTVDEARTWQDHTTGTFDIEVFGGGHFYLLDHQEAVLNRIRADLTGA